MLGYLACDVDGVEVRSWDNIMTGLSLLHSAVQNMRSGKTYGASDWNILGMRPRRCGASVGIGSPPTEESKRRSTVDVGRSSWTPTTDTFVLSLRGSLSTLVAAKRLVTGWMVRARTLAFNWRQRAPYGSGARFLPGACTLARSLGRASRSQRMPGAAEAIGGGAGYSRLMVSALD
jgi:hypothetical protein